MRARWLAVGCLATVLPAAYAGGSLVVQRAYSGAVLAAGGQQLNMSSVANYLGADVFQLANVKFQ